MNIADLIKYVDFLKERSNVIKNKLQQLESVRVSQRIVASSETTQVIEDQTPSMSVKDFTSEFDANAKELRLAKQTLERLNHTTDSGFEAKY